MIRPHLLAVEVGWNSDAPHSRCAPLVYVLRNIYQITIITVILHFYIELHLQSNFIYFSFI